jgi:hypothetical protein
MTTGGLGVGEGEGVVWCFGAASTNGAPTMAETAVAQANATPMQPIRQIRALRVTEDRGIGRDIPDRPRLVLFNY